MTRASIGVLFLGMFFLAYPQDAAGPPVVIGEPAEEDTGNEKPQEYTFNPLQAANEVKVGKYYLKKGSYRAALGRFQEALKWDPSRAEAALQLGDTHLKLGDKKAAKAAYQRFLALSPNSKDALDVRKKLERL